MPRSIEPRDICTACTVFHKNSRISLCNFSCATYVPETSNSRARLVRDGKVNLPCLGHCCPQLQLVADENPVPQTFCAQIRSASRWGGQSLPLLTHSASISLPA